MCPPSLRLPLPPLLWLLPELERLDDESFERVLLPLLEREELEPLLEPLLERVLLLSVEVRLGRDDSRAVLLRPESRLVDVLALVDVPAEPELPLSLRG
jgi:hypothetical protein